MRALDALERETFREQMAAVVPDEGYWAEAADWLGADLASPRRPAPGTVPTSGLYRGSVPDHPGVALLGDDRPTSRGEARPPASGERHLYREDPQTPAEREVYREARQLSANSTDWIVRVSDPDGPPDRWEAGVVKFHSGGEVSPADLTADIGEVFHRLDEPLSGLGTPGVVPSPLRQPKLVRFDIDWGLAHPEDPADRPQAGPDNG
jgi:hypothetical protein